MNKNKLSKEIIYYCNHFKIIDKNIDNNAISERIIESLDDVVFVENLLKFFEERMYLKRYSNIRNSKRFKIILNELEVIRTKLEFKALEH